MLTKDTVDFKKILPASFMLKDNPSSGRKGFTAIINTDIVDHDNEVLLPKGCDTKGWIKNPALKVVHGQTEDVKGQLPI